VRCQLHNLADVRADDPPPAYAYGPNPAFRYPKRNDSLFITVSTQPRILYFPRAVMIPSVGDLLWGDTCMVQNPGRASDIVFCGAREQSISRVDDFIY